MANISYKFVKMDLTQFSPIEENFRKDGSPVGISTGFAFGYNAESRVLRCTTTLQFVQNEQVVLNAELQAFFEIMEESLADITEGTKLTLPNGILCQFASLGYGSFRGILYMKFINTPYSDIILPPLYVFEIIKDNLVIDLQETPQ